MFHSRILMRVPCGGGHRSWDCILQNEFITFLYIRNKQVYVSDFPLSFFTSPVLLVNNFFILKILYYFTKIQYKIIYAFKFLERFPYKGNILHQSDIKNWSE